MKVEQNIKVAVDAVVFGYETNHLSVLLIKRGVEPFKNTWALPGGLVLENESLETAVERELQEETGVTIDYLEQLYTYGKPNRDPRNRVVSVSYFGLVKPKHFKIEANTDAAEAKWFFVDNLPELAFDHSQILDTALLRLKSKLSYKPIGFDLLKKEFPFSDLENLYTSILQKNIDRRNFRKKIMSFGIVEETNKMRQKASGRPAKLFKFNKVKYDALVTEGFHFDIKFV